MACLCYVLTKFIPILWFITSSKIKTNLFTVEKSKLNEKKKSVVFLEFILVFFSYTCYTLEPVEIVNAPFLVLDESTNQQLCALGDGEKLIVTAENTNTDSKLIQPVFDEVIAGES